MNAHRRKLRSIVLAAAAVVLGCAPAALPAAAARSIQAASLLSVQSGHSVVLRTSGLSRVAVGDGRIAGVVPIGVSQLVVNGKAPGHTTIFVWASGRLSTYEVTVTEQQVDELS